MKNRYFFVLGLLLLVPMVPVHSQKSSEYVFGIHLSSMTVKTNGIRNQAQSPAGFHFGGVFYIPFNNRLTLRPGLIFSAKGADYSVDTVDISISPIYFEVPLDLVYTFGSKALKVSFFAGPYFAYGVGGYKIETGRELKYIRYGSGKNSDMRPFDGGLGFGTRLDIRGLKISLGYETGFANLAPLSGSATEMRNQFIGVSLSAGSNLTRTIHTNKRH